MKRILLPLLILLLSGSLSVAYGQIITTLAGNGISGDTGDGNAATAAELEEVWFNAIDGAGNIYITDNFDHRVRKVSPAGIITTYAGNGSAGFGGDGGLATNAQFIGAAGIAVDHGGNVYFSDINNRRVRKVTPAGYIYTIAGSGGAGFTGDGGQATAAELNTPYGVAVDAGGNVYVADELNFRIRKITPAGIITTIAGSGTGGYSGDGGPALAAQITPTGIAIDGITGDLYIATNNRIRKINSAGIISTVAGNGIAGFSGDSSSATSAKLNQPVGIATDGLGNIFIADQYNYRIRKVNDSGIINTIAGTGIAGFSGDGGAATAAKLQQLLGLCTDQAGDIMVCDYGNFRIRKIVSGNHLPHFINWPTDSMAVCENSIGDSVNQILTITDADTAQTEYWSVITPAMHGTANIGHPSIATGDTVVPTGLSYTPATGYAGRDTFKVMVNDGYSFDTVTVYMIVKPLPDTGIITGNANVCMGRPDTLADTVAGGVWSAVNTKASVSVTGVVNGFLSGGDTILNTFILNGCVSVAHFPVTVFPVTDTITGPVAVCTGKHIALSGSPAGGSWNVTNDLATIGSGVVTGDTAGIDTVFYTISNYCGIFSTTYPVTVIGFTIPTVEITSTPPTILAGQLETLVAHVTGGGGITYGYQWEKNNVIIPGATDSVYSSNSFLNNDSVTCFINNGPCNFETFTWTYILYHNDGIKNISAGNALVLSPDPNSGEFNLQGTVVSDNKEALIQVTDLLGREVYRASDLINNSRIDSHIALPTSYADGTYFLRISTSNTQTVVQFVVRK